MSEPKLESHPAANIFPLMSGDAFAELVESIKTRGQEQPIVLLAGRILDGRNRYLACLEAGIEPKTRSATEDEEKDAYGFVVAANLVRRQLTTKEKKAVILGLRKEGKSLRQISRVVGVSKDTVKRTVSTATVGDMPERITGADGKVRKASLKVAGEQGVGAPAATPLDRAKAECSTASDIARRVHEIGKEVEALIASGVAPFPWLHGQHVSGLIEQLKSEIRSSFPHSACPWCAGQKCKNCKNCGWLPKDVYEHAPDAIRSKFEKGGDK